MIEKRRLTRERMGEKYGVDVVERSEAETHQKALDAGCQPESFEYWEETGGFVVCVATDGQEFRHRGQHGHLSVRRAVARRMREMGLL